VLLAAPTGLAACAIRGRTLHSLLRMDVQHGSEGSFKSLSDIALSELKQVFRNVRLLIIDEISMVSNVFMAKLHRRLCEIKQVGSGESIYIFFLSINMNFRQVIRGP
jgi:hypothetical protein